MFIDSIKLGFRDIFKNLKIFSLFLLLISSITIILTPSSISLIEILRESSSKINYNFIPISRETKNFMKIQSDVDKVFKKGGYCVIHSDYVNKKIDSNVEILFGKFQKNSKNKFLYSFNKENFKLLNQKNIKILALENLDTRALNLIGIDENVAEKMVFTETFGIEFNSILDFNLEENELYSMLTSTKFSNIDIENGLDIEFESAIQNEDIIFQKQISSNTQELNFIIKYIFVYTILLIVTFVICFKIFIKDLYKKLFREYKIHIVCGATKFNIFVRNSVFVMSLILINLIFISFLNKFRYDMFFSINIFLNVVYLIVLEFVVLNMLLRENLSETLMGGEAVD